MLKQLLSKLLCRHKWEVVTKTEYSDCDRYLLQCPYCGKLTKKIV